MNLADPLPIPPVPATLATTPSWLNKARNIDRSACAEVRAGDVWPDARFAEPRPGSGLDPRVEAVGVFRLTAEHLAMLHAENRRTLVGDRRTTKSNALRPDHRPRLEPTVADVVARTRLHCLLVPSEQVEPFLLGNPRIMYRVLQTEARRVRTTDERRL